VLRAFADSKLIHRQRIQASEDDWETIQLDLTAFAGRTIPIRLENHAYNLSEDFAYWDEIKVVHEP
jgi:hypothetical protein